MAMILRNKKIVTDVPKDELDSDLTRLYLLARLRNPLGLNPVYQFLLSHRDFSSGMTAYTLKEIMLMFHDLISEKQLYTLRSSPKHLLIDCREDPALLALVHKPFCTWPQLTRCIERHREDISYLTEDAVENYDGFFDGDFHFPCRMDEELTDFLRRYCGTDWTENTILPFSNIHDTISDYIHSNNTMYDFYETVYCFKTPLEDLFSEPVFPERRMCNLIANHIVPIPID